MFLFRKWLADQVNRLRRAKRALPRSRRRLEVEPLEVRLAPAILTVNTTDDDNVRNTVLALREAMLVANGELAKTDLTAQEKAQVDGDPTGASFDTIKFVIGNGERKITVTKNLPLPILNAGPVFIDGTPPALHQTQRIVLDGTNAGNNANGLVIDSKDATTSASNSGVVGLTIQNFKLSGIHISDTSGNTIGGSGLGELNLIQENRIGIEISFKRAFNNKVIGNHILNNKLDAQQGGGFGILIHREASSNTVGKEASTDLKGVITTPANVISGNQAAGVAITNRLGTGNVIIGNFIGLAPDGTTAMGNTNQGVAIKDGSFNRVGGLLAGERNTISKNNLGGVEVSGVNATDNLIQGNNIGTTKDGTGAAGNKIGGVIFSDKSAKNKVKTSRIRFNEGAGVTGNKENQIYDPNSISGNQYGIDNGDLEGVPDLTSAVVSGTTIHITGTLNHAPDSDYILEFFGNEVAEHQGKVFLGSVPVHTDLNGYAPIDVYFNTIYGSYVTATSTGVLEDGFTSEFSDDVMISGLSTLAAVGDFVFADLDGDGLQDQGEPGIAGVLVEIISLGPNSYFAQTTTDQFGHYLFTDLQPGSYYIQFYLPSGYQFTLPYQGDSIFDSDADPIDGATGAFTLIAGQVESSIDAGLVAYSGLSGGAFRGPRPRPRR